MMDGKLGTVKTLRGRGGCGRRRRRRRKELNKTSADTTRRSYLMFSTVSSGMGATVWTAGRFLLVAPLTKLEEEEEEEEAEEALEVGNG